MTWTPECRLTIEDMERWEKQRYEKNKPMLEQVITAYEMPGPQLSWVAHMTSDPHIWATGDTQEEATGRLWLTYPHLIIEQCKMLQG